MLPIKYVRQFTGLLDKEGNRVFEGDYIGMAGAYIVWDNDRFCWAFAFENDPIITPLFYDRRDFKVMGSIYYKIKQ